METTKDGEIGSPQQRSYRTYEEWKPPARRASVIAVCVLTVPMRNGNIEKAADIIARGNVLTVPMRNGNQIDDTPIVDGKLCSYRTYEEWKRMNAVMISYKDWVLTVPMRNGNSWLVFLQEHQVLVLTVPMRNGNYDKNYESSLEPIVLTVPMRNGNKNICKKYLTRIKFLPYL